MTVDLNVLETSPRLLFAIPLRPLQGQRFQPTGFPGLGAATFQTPLGMSLLVESAQSMANWLERATWDQARDNLRAELDGLSHVRVERNGAFLTSSVLEAHRLNSPYILKSKTDQSMMSMLVAEFGGDVGAVDRRAFASFLLRHDVGSLLHGVFLSQSELKGGRLRIARSLSAFIEADGVRIAPSGGVKNDHIHPSKVEGDKEGRFGTIPFARDEFTGEHITLYVNLDLAQIRGYGLGDEVERMLILLSLYKLRLLLDGSLRLRTACDLEPVSNVVSTRPKEFALPLAADLKPVVGTAIGACREQMTVTTVVFDDVLKKAKGGEGAAEQGSADHGGAADGDESGNEA
jgi:CRISPR-associated protein Csb1